jgi:hypothetical protein
MPDASVSGCASALCADAYDLRTVRFGKGNRLLECYVVFMTRRLCGHSCSLLSVAAIGC